MQMAFIIPAQGRFFPRRAMMLNVFSKKEEEAFKRKRLQMVRNQIAWRGVKDPRVLKAMETVPRHMFVPPREAPKAYEDHPLAIGHNQTISQPYIVGYMTELLELAPEHKVLEVGAGSGYQSAILAEICSEVYSMEIIPSLARESARRLKALKYANIHVQTGNGYAGWPEHAPYDGIIVTAAPEDIPRALIDQLSESGRLVIPIGSSCQDLILVTRTKSNVQRETMIPVRFVPMTGNSL